MNGNQWLKEGQKIMYWEKESTKIKGKNIKGQKLRAFYEGQFDEGQNERAF